MTEKTKDNREVDKQVKDDTILYCNVEERNEDKDKCLVDN